MQDFSIVEARMKVMMMKFKWMSIMSWELKNQEHFLFLMTYWVKHLKLFRGMLQRIKRSFCVCFPNGFSNARVEK